MFLYGMRLMSASLKEGSTGAMKTIMSKLTDNLFKSFLLGIILTALIQSSTATIVITSGLVAASIIPFKQSLGIIIGANIGTTVTGQIIRLMDLNNTSVAWLQFFKPATLAPVALIIGIVMIMFLNFRKSETIGTIFMGFGVLFTGLMNMTNAVSELNATGIFDSLFVHLSDSPIIGYGIGLLVSFILQSSSATVGILQAFSISGQLFFKSIYTVLLGIYLGDCSTTAIVCSIGAKSDARRVGIVNILYNLSETVVVLVLVTLLKSFGLLDGIWNAVANSGMIANTNTVFNSVCAIVLLPFVGMYEKLAYRIIKDDNKASNKYAVTLNALDTKFFASPALALNATYDALLLGFNIADEQIHKAFDIMKKYDKDVAEEIALEEENLDEITDKVSGYIVQMSQKITDKENSLTINQYYTDASEFERLGDHALNLKEAADKMNEGGYEFSKSALEELDILKELIDNVLNYARQAFTKRDTDAADHIEPLEEVVDDMIAVLKDNHIKRLQDGKCTIVTGTIFLNALSDIERISDICSNIGIATVSRVKPELALLSHDYISSMHNKQDNDFHKEYNIAHDYYFNKLNSIIDDKDAL